MKHLLNNIVIIRKIKNEKKTINSITLTLLLLQKQILKLKTASSREEEHLHLEMKRKYVRLGVNKVIKVSSLECNNWLQERKLSNFWLFTKIDVGGWQT